jgi:tight adherence protein C
MTSIDLIVGLAAFTAVMVAGALARRPSVTAGGAPVGPARDPLVPGAIARSLSAAGIDDIGHRRIFVLVAVAVAAVGAAAGWLAAWYLGLDGSPAVLLGAMGASTLLLAQIPFGWLASRIAARRAEILTNFAIMLDLLQLAVEGGMGLAAAWSTVTDALGHRGGALAAEMRRVDVQVGLGASWTSALHDAGARTGVSEFGSLGSLLGQAERFGTEVGRAIRVQCDAMRNEEVESIEERAHRASVKIVVPLVGLFLPAALLVTFVPLLIIVIEALSDATAD